MSEQYIPSSEEVKKAEGMSKEAELKTEFEIIEKKLSELPTFVTNHSDITENTKREVIKLIERNTDEIRERLKTIFKEVL